MWISKRIRRDLWTLVLCVAFAACGSDSERIDTLIARGDADREAARHREAVLQYRSALQLDPNRAAAHWGLARSYLALQQVRDGLWELQESVRLDPENREARLRFGELSLVAGDTAEALAQARAVIAADARSVEALLLRARVEENQQQLDEARQTLEAAESSAATREHRVAVLRAQAGFHSRRGEREATERALLRWTELAPGFDSFSALAESKALGGDDTDAEAAYRKALALASGTEAQQAYLALARFLYDRTRFTDAALLLEEGSTRVEDPLELIYQLAHFYLLEQEPELADELVRRAADRAPDDVRPLLMLARYERARGRLSEARAAATRALAIAAEDDSARVLDADLRVELEIQSKAPARFQAAKAAIDEILRRNPTHPEAMLVRARIDALDGRVKESRLALESATQAWPTWGRPHYLLGALLSDGGDFRGANAELERALELDPTLFEARRLIVRLHQASGHHDAAIEEARIVLRGQPDDFDTRLRLAESLVRSKNPAAAQRELDVIPEAARGAEVYFALGKLAQATGNAREARAHFERALEKRPNAAELLAAIAAMDRSEGHPSASADRIARAVEAEPSNAALRVLRSEMALLDGRDDEALAELLKAIEVEPSSLLAYQRLATLYIRKGQVPDAIRTYERAIEQHPERGELHFLVGVLCESAGQIDRAIESYETAIERNPELGQAKNNAAYLYAESGRELDRALELAREAKAANPSDPNFADTLGWVLYKRREPSAAIEYLIEAESGYDPIDPNLGAVRQHLALALEAAGRNQEAGRVAERGLRDLATMEAELRAQKRAPAPALPWAEALRAVLARSAEKSATPPGTTGGA